MLCGISHPAGYFLADGGRDIQKLGLYLLRLLPLAIFDFFNRDGNAIEKIGRWNRAAQWALYVVAGLAILFLSQKGMAAEFVYFQF